jgi:hypothetical protein
MRADLCLVALGAAGPEVSLVLTAGEVAYARGLPVPLPPVAGMAAGVAVPSGAGGTRRGATAVEVTAGSPG